VFAPTLPGHAGGPPLDGPVSADTMPDAVEAMLDELGWDTAHIAGNSMGGHMALQLAARGRARSVVALAPAGGWAVGDDYRSTLTHFTEMQTLLESAIPHAEQICSTPEGRRRATAWFSENYEHIPADLCAHMMRGAGNCPGVYPLIDYARDNGWTLDAEKIDVPVRVVWGTADRILEYPRTAARFKSDWVPTADWVELDGVGHGPQLDVPLETAELILGWTAY
jgi:pimeloyl-ACP methyl ester carboxylesterase